MITNEKKEKLRKLLLAISSDEEKERLAQEDKLSELAKATGELDQKVGSRIESLANSLVKLLEKNSKLSVRHSGLILESLVEFSDVLSKKIDDIKEITKERVMGPPTAQKDNVAVFSNDSGKAIKDSGRKVSELVEGEGVSKITVSKKSPDSPKTGDLWVKIR